MRLANDSLNRTIDIAIGGEATHLDHPWINVVMLQSILWELNQLKMPQHRGGNEAQCG